MTATRVCAECAQTFTATRAWQRFCCEAHKQRFHKLMAKRGQMLAPLLIASAENRRYAGGDRELAAYGRREADALVSAWVVEDRSAGRSCALVAAGKQEDGWRAVDAV